MGNLRALAIPDATSRANQRRALSISLRALKHPLTLASIGLLLLNDHVLKVLMPSLLTGKLSDFAGLFFFSFLLAALLSLSWRAAIVSPLAVFSNLLRRRQDAFSRKTETECQEESQFHLLLVFGSAEQGRCPPHCPRVREWTRY